MANHKSAKKRIRSSEKKRIHNRYYIKTLRTYVKKMRSLTDKVEAQKMFPMVASLADKLAKKGIIHKNKASNLKSGLMLMINKM